MITNRKIKNIIVGVVNDIYKNKLVFMIIPKDIPDIIL